MIPVILLVLALAQWPPVGMECHRKTVVFLRIGPNWDQRARVFPKHAEYNTTLMKKGVILASGPMQGGRAMAVYNSVDTAEVEAAAKADPFVAEGVLLLDSQAAWDRCTAAPAAGRE